MELDGLTRRLKSIVYHYQDDFLFSNIWIRICSAALGNYLQPSSCPLYSLILSRIDSSPTTSLRLIEKELKKSPETNPSSVGQLHPALQTASAEQATLGLSRCLIAPTRKHPATHTRCPPPVDASACVYPYAPARHAITVSQPGNNVDRIALTDNSRRRRCKHECRAHFFFTSNRLMTSLLIRIR